MASLSLHVLAVLQMEQAKLLIGVEILENVENQFDYLDEISKTAAQFGEVFTAENLLNALTSALAKKIGLNQGSDFAQNATFILTKIIVLETAQNVFNIGSGVKNLNIWTASYLRKSSKLLKELKRKLT